jgi:hypothetical protein
VKNFTEANGIESNHIWTIHKGKQGELWFGGENCMIGLTEALSKENIKYNTNAQQQALNVT